MGHYCVVDQTLALQLGGGQCIHVPFFSCSLPSCTGNPRCASWALLCCPIKLVSQSPWQSTSLIREVFVNIIILPVIYLIIFDHKQDH